MTVAIGASTIDVRIVDDGNGAGMGAGSGHGIVGMRERVELLDGQFSAGPQVDGGFEIHATLPLRERDA